jgi:hypothetical protein
LLGLANIEGSRKKEEGRGKKEEGRGGEWENCAINNYSFTYFFPVPITHY